MGEPGTAPVDRKRVTSLATPPPDGLDMVLLAERERERWGMGRRETRDKKDSVRHVLTQSHCHVSEWTA